jgi:myosin-3
MIQIPLRPPPTLSEPKNFSTEFNDFLAQCLKKNPDQRPEPEELLTHPFLIGAEHNKDSLKEMIREALAKKKTRVQFTSLSLLLF